MPSRHSLPIGFSCLLAVAAFGCFSNEPPGTVPADKPCVHGLRGQVAVVSFASIFFHADELIVFTAALGDALETYECVEVLPAGQVVTRLGISAPAAPALEHLKYMQSLLHKARSHISSAEHQKSLVTLYGRLLPQFHLYPSSPEQWKLFEQVQITEGIGRHGMNNDAAATRAFRTVLRSRPDMKLEGKHSPGILRLWEQARRLDGLPRGKLTVESEPSGAEVLLDGAKTGITPYTGELVHGQYHLQVTLPRFGGTSRWVTIGEKPTRVRLRLSYEGSLNLDAKHPHPILSYGDESNVIENKLHDTKKLGTRYLVIARRKKPFGQKTVRWEAALFDLCQDRKLREGRLEPSGYDTEQLRQDASDLAKFLVTGKAVGRLKVVNPL